MLRTLLFTLLCLQTLVWGGVAYIAGDQDQTAALWITNTTTGNIQTIPLASYGSYSSAQGVSYVTGYQNDGTYDVAILWIRNADGSYNNKITLGAPFSSAFYIYFPGRGGNTLENAFKRFSPMKYQRGY